MTVLPIVERELRVAARQSTTYWVRLGIGSAAIFVGAAVFVFTLGLSPAQSGRNIFEWLSGVMLAYCLAYGRRSTADCLSQEKRQGTLGLLFLTDLKGHDVVLGKLVATSVRGFYGLLAVFPVLAVPLLLGGVASGEFWRRVLVLTDTFLFSLAIGIFGSALTRDVRRALGANLLLLLLLMAVPPACLFALGYFAPGLRQFPQLLFSCPVYPFYLCDSTHYLLARDHFWWSVAVIHGLTWLLLLTASWIIPRSWQDRPARAKANRWRELWLAWRNGPTAGKAAFRKHALDANAFYWLAARARFKPVHVWTFLGCMLVWWLAGWIASGRLWLDPSVAVVTALMLNFALKVWVAIEAGQQLAEDRQSGAFELLLSVPLTVGEILRGQVLALRRQFLKPLLLVLGIQLLCLVMVRRRLSGWQTEATWLAGMVMLVVDLVALSWVGMWRALVARNHNLATISTVVRVLVLPCVLYGAIVGFGNVWYGLALGKQWEPGWEFYLGLWVGLGLAADLVFGLMAWWQLHHRFRELALARFNPASSGLARRFGPGRAQVAGSGRAEVAHGAVPPEQPQRGEERRERKETSTSAPFAPLRLKGRLKSSRVRLALACSIALLLAGLGFMLLRPRSHFPPPRAIVMKQTNGPVQVFSGSGGVVLILPDGSLWRWGRVGPAGAPCAAVPEQVGTNCDWLRAAGGYRQLVGVRRDGTLWEWKHPGEPRQVDPSHDWVSVAAAAGHSVALRRDGSLWAWGDNYASQLGNGGGPNQPDPVQVGTNSDWAAVCCPLGYTLALRRDGTLWAWGPVYVVGSGQATVSTVPFPTQVCGDSNWTGFSTVGFLPAVRDRSGQLWEPLHAPPNPKTSAAASFRLIVSNAVPGRFAAAWCGESRVYEVRPNGTLWERTQPLGGFSATPAGAWHRLGRRSDWRTLWGTGGTAFGLTADGTLWTWGIDPGRDPVPDFRSRLKLAQTRLASLFGPGPRPMRGGGVPVYEKQPRPLMRLVSSPSTPPSTAR